MTDHDTLSAAIKAAWDDIPPRWTGKPDIVSSFWDGYRAALSDVTKAARPPEPELPRLHLRYYGAVLPHSEATRAILDALSRESHADSPRGDGFVETRGNE